MKKSPGRAPAPIIFAIIACIFLVLACSTAAASEFGHPVFKPANPGGQQLVTTGSGGGSGDTSDIGSIVGSPDLFAQAQKPMTMTFPTLVAASTVISTAGTTGTSDTSQQTTVTGLAVLPTGLTTKNTGSVLLTSKGAITSTSGKTGTTGTVNGSGSIQSSHKGAPTTIGNLTGTTVASKPQKACTGANCSVKTGISLDSGLVLTGGDGTRASRGTKILCPAGKPVQTCSTNSLTGKTECTCSAVVTGVATDPHAGQKWCEVKKCYKTEATVNGKKLVPNGYVPGQWVDAGSECPDCSSPIGTTPSGSTGSQAFCDSFSGLEKEQCKKCNVDNEEDFIICKLSMQYGDNNGYKP